MKKTKIDWCDCTLNPVIGCKNGCEYCYARKLNDRFHFIENWDNPQFFPERLSELNSKKPKSVFMDSMSDCAFWDVKDIKKVAKAIELNPQHNYIFLTKRTGLFSQKSNIILKQENGFCKNVFIGTSVTTQNDLVRLGNLPAPFICSTFISFEPLLEEITLFENDILTVLPKQIIIGAETGNRKGKVIPKKEWVLKIVKAFEDIDKKFHDNHSIFMKESLREIMGEDFRQDKLIWEKNL